MSCWVVPSIAAELWGIPLQQILDRVKTGSVASKCESGFTFVDVAPNSPTFEPRAVRTPTPPTYTVVTREEMAALAGDEQEPFEQDEQSISLGDWRQGRKSAQSLRRRPVAA